MSQPYPPPVFVVEFVRSKKRFPNKGRAKFLGIGGQPTNTIVLPPAPISVVHFTGSLIRRGIPRKGTTLLVKRTGQTARKIPVHSIVVIDQPLRKRQLPQITTRLGKVPRRFNPFITTIAVNPITIAKLLRQKATPGKISKTVIYGVNTKNPKVSKIKVLSQHRPTRRPTRGRVKWGRVFGVFTVPKPVPHSISINIVSLVDNKRIRLRPYTTITWMSPLGKKRTNPKRQPVKAVSQVNRKHRLPTTRTQIIKVYGIKTKNPKVVPITNKIQILRKRQLPHTTTIFGSSTGVGGHPTPSSGIGE